MKAWTFLPLRAKDGTVRALTLIDAEDKLVVGRDTWRLIAGKYAGRVEGWNPMRTIYLHRVLLDADEQVDHINGHSLDNRRVNLRAVTNAENCQNRHVVTGRSRHRGVTWSKAVGKWVAACTINYKRHHLGCFEDEDEAGAAAAAFRAEHMPFSEEARV